jgi:hypothetical protein
MVLKKGSPRVSQNARPPVTFLVTWLLLLPLSLPPSGPIRSPHLLTAAGSPSPPKLLQPETSSELLTTAAPETESPNLDSSSPPPPPALNRHLAPSARPLASSPSSDKLPQTAPLCFLGVGLGQLCSASSESDSDSTMRSIIRLVAR